MHTPHGKASCSHQLGCIRRYHTPARVFIAQEAISTWNSLHTAARRGQFRAETGERLLANSVRTKLTSGFERQLQHIVAPGKCGEPETSRPAAATSRARLAASCRIALS